MKKAVIAVLAVVLAFGWISSIKREIGDVAAYHNLINEAELSEEGGLYEQAVEYYEKALEIFPEKDELYVCIKDAYAKFYEEQKDSDAFDKYSEAIDKCTELKPQSSDFWAELIKLYMDDGSYSSASIYINKALSYNATNEYITYAAEYVKYLYSSSSLNINGYKYMLLTESMTPDDFDSSDIYVVYNEDGYWIMNGYGDDVTKEFKYIGVPNDDGTMLYIDDLGTTIKDIKMISRKKLKEPVDEAGALSEGLIPVRIGEEWSYITDAGEKAFGSYEYATSFVNERAAVKEDGKWYIIQTDGEKVEGLVFTDIKLTLNNSYVHNGELIIAAEGTEYRLYNTGFEPIGEFSCKKIDIYTGLGPIAFSNGGNWGFVDEKGNIVIEPKFIEAKSFSNGYAAVKSKDGLWGFCTEDTKVVIDYAFFDGGYFNNSNECVIQRYKNVFEIIEFKYQED